MTLLRSTDSTRRRALAACIKADSPKAAEPRNTTFALEHVPESGFARFSDGRVSLVRFRSGWPWEFCTITQTGESRGLAMFVRYLRPDEAARLELALQTESARERLEAAGKDLHWFLAIRGYAVDVATGRLVD